MLGNFSIGDYFKQGAASSRGSSRSRASASTQSDIWVTVFEGDEELGLGPDEEAIEGLAGIGIPRERIVVCPRSENFWQAGPTGPAARARSSTSTAAWTGARPTTCPAATTSASWSTGTSCSCSSTRTRSARWTPLPAKNIDTGLGLNRMALIQQGVDSIFDTDQFVPLMTLGERARRPRARRRPRAADPGRPHARDDVPDRRRRRALQRGPRLRPAAPDAPRDPAGPRGRHRAGLPAAFVDVVSDTMGGGYPELARAARRRSDSGSRRGGGLRAHAGAGDAAARRPVARAAGARRASPREDAFRLHDTFGFPIDLTLELAAEQALGVDEQGFESLMDEQRARSRVARPRRATTARQLPRSQSAGAPATVHRLRDDSSSHHGRRRSASEDGRVLLKLAESPFYAAGGGQVSDAGRSSATRRLPRARRRRRPLRRRPGGRGRGGEGRAARGRARASRGSTAPRAMRRRATTPPRICCTRRCASAWATTSTRPAPTSGPDKLRFDFTHGARAQRGGRGAPSRTASTHGSSRNDPVRADHDDARRGARARRDGAVRREVRRRRAHGGGRRRLLLARAVRRHARALHRRDRPVQDHVGEARARRTCAASRPSPARRRSACCAATTSCCATAASALRTPPERCRRRSRRCGPSASGQKAKASGRRRGRPRRARRPRVAGRRRAWCSPRPSTASTPRRWSTSPTG